MSVCTFLPSARPLRLEALKLDRTDPGMVRCCRFRSTRSGAQVLPFSIIIYIPQLSRSLGESMRELRKGISGDVSDKKDEDKKKESDKTDVAA